MESKRRNWIHDLEERNGWKGWGFEIRSYLKKEDWNGAC